MNIVEFLANNEYMIVLKVNCIAIFLVVVVIYFIAYIRKRGNCHMDNRSLVVDEVSLGIGDNKVKLKYNKKDQEIAYKLWVELSTRKIGLEFDPKNDVIFEVYDSWHEFFTIARELMKEIPVEKLDGSSKLIELTEMVLNKGLRPHLTVWQAKFRKWYNNANENDIEKTPQQIQAMYPYYEELKTDLIDTNKRMIKYKELMERIVFER